jgi:hypothetical protein
MVQYGVFDFSVYLNFLLSLKNIVWLKIVSEPYNRNIKHIGSSVQNLYYHLL